MKLTTPTEILDFDVTDIYGDRVRLSDYKGRAVILSFFRDASCPFCLKRVFELCARHKQWQKKGVEIIAVFTSTDEEVNSFKHKYPKRITTIADPSLELYNQYGIESSATGFFKTFLLKAPTIIEGLVKGARPTRNPNGGIMPADFLINTQGIITEAWYGENGADHIPFSKLEDLVRAMVKQTNAAKLTSREAA
ncbi:MAG: peroxiredoxin family protein [Acidiferrobacterales bacterium]|nr:peroxiredoxin family protein [Acidiferrobacterales bacterium]